MDPYDAARLAIDQGRVDAIYNDYIATAAQLANMPLRLATGPGILFLALPVVSIIASTVSIFSRISLLGMIGGMLMLIFLIALLFLMRQRNTMVQENLAEFSSQKRGFAAFYRLWLPNRRNPERVRARLLNLIVDADNGGMGLAAGDYRS